MKFTVKVFVVVVLLLGGLSLLSGLRIKKKASRTFVSMSELISYFKTLS